MNQHADFAFAHLDRPAEKIAGAREFSLAVVFSAMRWRWRTIAGFVAVALLSALVYVAMSPKRFTARAVLLTETTRSSPSPAQNAKDSLIDNTIIESQIKIIQSDKVVLAVIDQLRLWEDDEFNGSKPGRLRKLLRAAPPAGVSAESSEHLKRQIARDSVKRALSIERVGSSYLAEIVFTSADPEKAARIANAVAQAYIDDQLAAKQDAGRRVSEWMQQRVLELRRQASATQQQVRDFNSTGGAATSGEAAEAGEREAGEIVEALALARADAAKSRARLDGLRALLQFRARSDLLDGQVSAQVEALGNPTLAAALNAFRQADRDGLDEAQKKALAQSLWNAAEGLTRSFASDAEAARSKADALERRRVNLVQRGAVDREGQERLGELEAETYKTIYREYLSHYTQALKDETFPVTEARLVTQAAAPLHISSPNSQVALFLAFLAGGLLGLAAAIWREFASRPVRGAAQVEREVGVRAFGPLPLATLPWRMGAPDRDELVGLTQGFRPRPGRTTLDRASETFRFLKVAVDRVAPRNGGCVIGVASAKPSEGKTTVACNLALQMSQGGSRVLLVDADVRDPTLTRAIIPAAPKGLATVFEGESELADAVSAHPSGFDVLGSRFSKENPYTALTPRAIAGFLAKTRESYDYVILDLPAMLDQADAYASADFVDAFVCVAESGRTRVDDLVRAIRGSDAVAQRLVGVLLNKARGKPSAARSLAETLRDAAARLHQAQESGSVPELPKIGWKKMTRRLARRPARFIRRNVLPHVLKPSRTVLRSPVAQVRVVGLLSSASGLGKSARLCVETLREAGHPVTTSDVAGLFGCDDGIGFPSVRPAVAGSALSIYHLNPPMLLPGLLRSGLSGYYASYGVGYWAWELECLPREWIDAIRYVDAIMVPSTFCRTAVSRYTDKPVLVVPHPVHCDVPATGPRRRHEHAPFRVLSVFNFGSSLERKNPVALVRAFRLAFGDDPSTLLVLKTADGNRYPYDLAHLQAEVGAARNITIMDGVMSEAQLDALFRAAGVYASLHRSEGFGLTIAEAIMQEIPVVTTGWSGNMDFCPPEHSFLVDYDLVPMRDSHPDCDQITAARWADPSVAHAAEQLRAVRDNQASAQTKAEALKHFLVRHLREHTYERALAALPVVTERQAESAPPLLSQMTA